MSLSLNAIKNQKVKKEWWFTYTTLCKIVPGQVPWLRNFKGSLDEWITHILDVHITGAAFRERTNLILLNNTT